MMARIGEEAYITAIDRSGCHPMDSSPLMEGKLSVTRQMFQHLQTSYT